jgi:SOS-response transcriptional repressor LexA
MEPKFHEGELIFVDPNVEAVNGKFVVVQLNDSNEATFKQLVIEDDRQYLKALNPNWPDPIIKLSADARICGVVVFKGEMI